MKINKQLLTMEDSDNLHLCFELDNTTYALNINYVLEVTKLPLISSPQKMPEFIMGLLNYNDLFINVIDIRKLLNLSEKQFELTNKVIIIKGDESLLAIVVDNVSELFTLMPGQTQRVMGDSHDKIVKTFYKLDKKLINIINIVQMETTIKKAYLSENRTDYENLFPKDKESLEILKKRSNEIAAIPVFNMETIFFGKDQYIIFTLNEHKYCIYSLHVKKLVNYNRQSITQIPCTPDYINGIMNLKGVFYTVINLKKFIGYDDPNPNNANKIIVIESSELKMAFLVDDIIDVINISPDNIVKKNEIKLDELYIKAEAYIDNKVYNILNIDKLVQDERLYIDNSV